MIIGEVMLVVTNQMTKAQMWNRYRALKRKNSNWKCLCPVCGEHIYENDSVVEYVKTKRGAEIFMHRECIGNWNK